MLKIKDLNAYYGKSHILRGIDLDIKKGEIIGFIGKNGAGTYLKTIE